MLSWLSNQPYDWRGLFAQGNWRLGVADVANGELNWSSRFGESGLLASVGLTHDYSEQWYQTVSLTASTSGSFWPHTEFSTELFKKWLDNSSLITGVGFRRGTYTTGASDFGFLGEIIYYTGQPIVLGLGYWFNESFPGTVPSSRIFGSVTLGAGWSHQLIVRYDTGREAYQPVGFGIIATEYASNVLTATLRLFTDQPYGGVIEAEHYSNPFYIRNTLSVALLHNF